MKTKILCNLVVAVFLFCGCSAVSFQYPKTAPCIKMNMNTNLTLTGMKTGQNPLKAESELAGATVQEGTGSCDSTPDMDVTLNPGGGLKGTMTFNFKKEGSQVQMEVDYVFVPDQIFNNGDNTPRTMKSNSMDLSQDTASYTCSPEQEIVFSKIDGQTYQYGLKMVISDVQVQAFNINNGAFSPAEDCSALDVTSEAPTSQPPAPTTQPPAPTTQPPAAPTTQPQANNDTSTEAPATKPPSQTTEPPPSMPPNNGTSEAPANGTTMAPTTMAPSNATTEAPSNGTTMAPGTTEQPTTMAPGPTTPTPGSPAVNTYKATTGNTTCLLFKAGIEFKMQYAPKDASKGAQMVTIGVPAENATKYTGNCNGTNSTQSITLTFYNGWDLTMTFAASDKNFYLNELSLDAKLTPELVPGINATTTVSVAKKFETSQFAASKSGSYKCSGDSKVTLKDGMVEMDTYNLQYAAFQTNIDDFTDSEISECSSDTSTNSVVPIAVGAALAGLVVIVLIAYLIGRKRSRQSGYEQV